MLVLARIQESGMVKSGMNFVRSYTYVGQKKLTGGMFSRIHSIRFTRKFDLMDNWLNDELTGFG